MAAPRLGHTATVLAGGRVLVTGGEAVQGVLLPAAPGTPAGVYARASMELYDPATGKFAAAGRMSTPRAVHTAIRTAGGRVLVAGGHAGDGSTGGSELFT